MYSILRSLLVVILIFIPVILPNVILGLTKDSTPYIYYKSVNDPSYIKVIQGALLNGIDTEINGGTLKYYNSNDQMDEFTEGSIVRVLRSQWERNLTDTKLKKVAAIIIIDSGDYQPSSPLFDLRFNDDVNVPVILVQSKDYDSSFNLASKRDRIISITFHKDNIPEPEWKCDIESTETKNCFKPVIDPETRIIVGVQHRKKECMWGQKPCRGFKNELETMDQCGDVPESLLCNKDRGFSFPERPGNGSYTYRMKVRPRSCRLKGQSLEPSDCRIWSNWLRWRIDGQQNINYEGHFKILRLRYCITALNGFDECLFQDSEFTECCAPLEGQCQPETKLCSNFKVFP